MVSYTMVKAPASEFTIRFDPVSFDVKLGKILPIATFYFNNDLISKKLKQPIRLDLGITTVFLVKMGVVPVVVFPVFNFDALLEIPVFLHIWNFEIKIYFRHQSGHFVDGSDLFRISSRLNFSREDIGARFTYKYKYFFIYSEIDYFVNKHVQVRPFEFHNGFQANSPFLFGFSNGL